MGIYLNPWFYTALGFLYCGLQWQPPQLSRTTWFGLLNIAALTVVLSFRIALLVFIFAIALWSSLRILQAINRSPIRRIFEIAIYLAFTLAFIFHKLIPEWIITDGAAGSAPLRIAHGMGSFFETVAFSYVYLRTLDALRSVIGGSKLLNPAGLSGYLVPFFMMPAGPVNVYADHASMDLHEMSPPTWEGFVWCADTITSGLFLKFVVAEIWKLWFIGVQSSWPTETFLDAAAVFIYVYFDFSGYSLVALGTGRLLAVPTPLNFKAPLLSRSVTEFWTRWHISLGDFIRRHLFIPFQVSMVRRFGRRWAYVTNMLALVACFVFVGLWHRFTLTFAVWGLAIGVIVAVEKVVRDRWITTRVSKSRVMRLLLAILGPIYVFVVIVGTLWVAIPELMGQPR
jgi:D-alanyl-lipoteichoic acid acyltransferase DltB (MBOAT superfamily)